MHHNNPTATLPPKAKSLKSKNNRRNRRRRRSYKQYSHSSSSSFHNPPQDDFIHQLSYNVNPRGFDLWRQTYENIMSWQSEHQVNYWRNQAQNFRNINEELWTKLKKYEAEGKVINEEENKIPVYETSSSEEDENLEINNKSDIDEEYLKFLEITHKHQNDRKLSEDKVADENPNE